MKNHSYITLLKGRFFVSLRVYTEFIVALLLVNDLYL